MAEMDADAPILHYKEMDQMNTSTTLIFLHGLFSSPAEFMDVTCLLSEYRLILVDQPGHSGSKHIPFSLDNATKGLHRIITEKDLVGKAHLVGLSLGGFVALEYARRYPGAAKSISSSGATPFVGWQKWFAERPTIIYHLLRIFVASMPGSVYWWYCRRNGVRRHDDLRKENKQNMNFKNTKNGFRGCLQVQIEQIQAIERTRVLLVAGGQGDDVESTRAMASTIKEKCPGSRAFVVQNAIHGWDLQFPEIFAQGVRSWIKATETLPKEFEELF